MKRSRSIIQLAGAGAAIAPAVPVLAHADQGGAWDHHGMMWGGGGGWIMGPIMMLLLLAVAVAIVVLLVRWLGGAAGGPGAASAHRPGVSALQVLEERFARGEIDEEEFRQRKKALEE